MVRTRRHRGARRSAPRIVSRGDSNLFNWLWGEPNVHVVDWEFIGHSDTVYDAAELVEHLSARVIDDEWRVALLPDHGIVDDTARRRFLAAQRTVALSLLWKRGDKRADDVEFQVKWVRELMNSSFL
nr:MULTISPECIES: phosphotransferase [Amycolatopsis]